jgi:hypothetical protein
MTRRFLHVSVGVIVVVVCSGVLAACGSSTHPQPKGTSSVDQYLAGVAVVYKPVVSAFNAATDCPPPVKAATKCVAEDTKLMAAADALAAGLARLTTPPQLVSARDGLRKAALGLSAILGTRVKLLDKHDLAETTPLPRLR